MDVGSERNRDTCGVLDEGKLRDTDESTIQGILTHSAITEERNDCQVSSNRRVMDNNTNTISDISSNAANQFDKNQPEVRSFRNDPVIVTQSENIIDEQAQEAQESSINSNMTSTSLHEEIRDDFNINIPNEGQTPNNEEMGVTYPTRIPPSSPITVAFEEQIHDIANESHHVIRTHRNSIDTTHTEEQNQTTEFVYNDYSASPPDYAECIIMEYYNNNGLVCCGSQTTTDACFCSCHSETGSGNTSQNFTHNVTFLGVDESACNVNTASTNVPRNKEDKKVKYLFWFIMIFLVVAGAVYGTIAAVSYD
ncbi:uncharacterized protein LOC123559402 [Mercenaria mercenaria]|uniref:uncharacterized protein LOC123559402 n=1 Tax=Mercenaria mercenaria TaxID=6596 RepID=UPI00234E653A|nr:uncharacterized protein LOC123559402 [Mercenaria mercenaria]